MPRRAALLLVLSLVLAGCAGGELDEEPMDAEDGTSPEPTPAAPTGGTAPATTPENGADLDVVDPTPPGTTEAEIEPETAARPKPIDMMPRTPAPAGDADRDGIPDAKERALSTSCIIAGRTCADLGLKAPTVGVRDLILVQLGRSGVEQNWRYSDSVWASFHEELANLSIVSQVAHLGLRDDINVSARWNDPANDGQFWHLWVIYNDPATAITEGSSGTQLYDLITLAERGDPLEERATILHEAYHALMGDLDGGRSRCADEEIGGPSHSADEDSVLYTSPDCETNEGSVYRLGDAELIELRENAFAVLTEMNAPGWAGAAFEEEG